MATIYRLQMSASGLAYIEDYDLELLRNMRQTAGKTPEEWPIIPLDIKFIITNDPQLRQFDDIDEAQTECNRLATETFELTFTKTIISPPPDGFTG